MAIARPFASPREAVRRAASVSWRPMVITGFSENFGSCMTIDMRMPRRARHWRGVARLRSMPSKASRSAVARPGGGVRPKIARPVWLLPEPLSPTIPSRSRPRVKLTPRTTSEGPCRVGKVTRRFST